MRVGFIFVLYQTPKKEIIRLKKEVKNLKLTDYQIYFIDNSNNHQGYGFGVNQGIKKAINDHCQVLVIANPDISIKDFVKKNFLLGLKYFDILGFSFRQEGKIFYAGKIDSWRLSGGLITEKPKQQFEKKDFISGSLMVIKKSVIDKIGFFDESYFMYYEDVDFCYRAKKAGFKIGIDSQLCYDHFEVSKYNPLKEKWLFFSHYRFFFKYSNIWQKIRELVRLPKTVIEEIKKRQFYLNFFSLNLFSIVNKFLSFILFLVLTNRFSPADYGVYTLAWAHIALFTPLLDFGTTVYGLVNLTNQKKEDLNSLISSRLLLGLISFFLSNLVSLMIYFHQPKILLSVILLSVVFFTSSLSGSYLIYCSLKEKSYLQGFFNLIFQTCLTLLTIITVFISNKINFLFYLYFLLYGLYGIFYLWLFFKELKINFFQFQKDKFFQIISSSYLFLLINLLASWYGRVDIFLLNFLKNLNQVGIYSSAVKFIDALLFIATAYNFSSISLYSRLIKTNQLSILKRKITIDFFLLSVIGFLISFLIGFFGQIIFLLMKKDYYLALPVLKIVIFNLPLILISSIAINVIYGYKKEIYIVYLFFIQLLVHIFFNWLLIPFYGYFASAWLSVFGWLINSLILWIIAFRLLNKKNKKNHQQLKISVDAGSLSGKNYSGTKIFSENLIKTLLTIDKKNQYFLYQLKKVSFLNLFWLKVQLLLREFFNKKDLFLGLNQAIPFYVSGKIISFSHGLSFYFYPDCYEKKILKKLNKQLKEIINQSEKIIVSSKKVKRELLKINQKLSQKILTFPFGVPLDLLDYLKKHYSNKKRKKFFLVVARNEKIKNLEFIKKVFFKLKKMFQFKDFQLKIITKENNREKLFSLYQSAYCLLTASKYESFNFPVLEGLVAGCPVVGLSSAIIPEFKDYVNIAKNEKEFIRLIRNPKIIPDKKMIEKIKTQFSWESYGKKIIKLYKELV